MLKIIMIHKNYLMEVTSYDQREQRIKNRITFATKSTNFR
jgi:heme exporter protein D